MEALEVFALTSDMQRATGSIPYTSLMWDRKYYEPGSFLMELPANVYDPSWAYIYTDERPETGIIQKVEYSDTATTAGGVDTVILSGFFLESELNRYTFLAEETEEEAYRIYKPAPAKTVKPTLWQAEGGQTYVKHESLGSPTRWETLEGDYVDPAKLDTTGLTEIELGAGEGLKLREYETTNLDRFPTGFWTANEYTNENYSYYSEDGKTLHSVAPDGTEKTFDIVRGGTGDVIYEDSDGSLKWVNGVASSLGGTYVRARDSWEKMVKTEGLEVVTGYGTIMGGSTYARAYRTVKGPWQLRTDLDVNEPADNVQRIIQWAQDIWGNNLLYDEVGFAGEEKIIDPSLKLFGDLAYEELKTIGASPRLSYSFESDTCVFEVWRGLDRTQSQAGVPAPPTPDEPEPDEPTIEDLYEAVDYIQSDGTQYIDTGFAPNQDTRLTMSGYFPEQTTNGSLFGVRTSASSGLFTMTWVNTSSYFLTNYNTDGLQISFAAGSKFELDKNKNVTTLNGTAVTATYAAFTCMGPLYLFATNSNGSVMHKSPMRLSACRIYDNGTLVRDFAPYRRKADGVFGMLDLVNEVFYESASGVPFTGPSYAAGTYEELDYIVSTGEQYIDTGVVPSNDTRVKMDARAYGLTDISAYYAFFGARVSGSLYELFKSSKTSWELKFLWGANTSNSFDIDYSARHQLEINGNTATVDGETLSYTDTTFSVGYSLYLGATNNAGSPLGITPMFIYGGAVYEDGVTLSRDYVPRRRVSDGEVGLLDLANDTFYTSAGSEPFYAPGAAVAEASTFALTRTVATSDESNTAANPFAVFSDTWGTLYGFTASRDVSNYRNTCYVLYQFRDQVDSDGNPIGPRGFVKARLEDELPDAETYLDLRGEEPEEGQTDEAFIESLRQRGLAHLQANYAAIESLDTGTLAGDGYLTGYDLGDKVDMLVEAIGLVKEARITGVCEVHEAGSSTATLEIGEQKLTNIRKAVIV